MEIKIRYVFGHNDGRKDFVFKSIEQIEDIPLIKKTFNFRCIARNLFIGSQDVAGNDIYKGDICDLGGCVCVIDFINNGFYAVSVENDEKYFGWNPKSIRVIGNIYQNPELIAKHEIVNKR